MKEKDLLKSAADLKMPDLEQIRQNVINSFEQPENQPENKDVKPKIVKLRPSRLIAVAAIVALAVIGTIAAVANQNGGLFAPAQEESTASETTKPSTSAPKETKKVSKSSAVKVHKPTAAELKKAKIEKYKNRLKDNGYSVTDLHDLGKVEGYHIVYAGDGSFTHYDCDYVIGDYTFSASKHQTPYGLGIYICGKKHSYTLADAYSKRILDNFSAAVEKIKNYTKLDLGIEITEKLANSENFRNYFGGKDIISLAKVKSSDEYELYFTIPENAKHSSKGKIIGDYTFILNAEQEPYDLGLYVVSGDTISTLEDAVENGVIDMDTVNGAVHTKDSIPYTFTLSITDEDETEKETEEETEVIKDTEEE